MHPEHIKVDASKIKAAQTYSLNWLIHEVGDMNQPFHAGRAEDQGGNNILMKFNGKRTNLHSLWDSELIDHQGLSGEELAKQYDNSSREQIKQWQSDAPIEWLWESYLLTSELYEDARSNKKIDEVYYNEHLPIIKKRIEIAGVRLAGLLNECFKNQANLTILSAPDVFKNPVTTKPLTVEQVIKHIGDSVYVCSKSQV